MPGSKARQGAPSNATRAELELECAAQLRRIGDKLNSIGRAADISAVLAEMPGKKARKSSPQSPSSMRVPADLEAECAQLRRIGDKLNFRQKLLNLISKLFNLIT